MAFSFSRLTDGLRKTQQNWTARIKEAVGMKERLDAETLEQIEEILLAGDVGVDTSAALAQTLKADFARIDGRDQALERLKDELVKRLRTAPLHSGARPEVTLLVGVNGSGKTTTAAKLAYQSKASGQRVLLAACDTFRAAAIDQLAVWAKRVDVDVISGKPQGDPAAVAHDAVQAAVARGVDRLFIDTAGRLHTKTNLMAELRKIARVIGKALPGAPHEVLLVLDATTGQNGLRQALEFHKAVPLTGVVLTKLDGTAKGGIIFAVSDVLGVPVKYVGLGEKAEDLDSFDPAVFVDALFAEKAGAPA
jgi:fused signal recognition particle receptor